MKNKMKMNYQKFLVPYNHIKLFNGLLTNCMII